MSQLDAFAQKVQQDPDLQERLKGAESEAQLVERVLSEAQALGFDLDAEEIHQRLTVTQDDTELSDAELDAVAGGTANPDGVTWGSC